MLTALAVSLAPPLLWSVVNYVDKFMLSGRFSAPKDALMVYSAGFSCIALCAIVPFAYREVTFLPIPLMIQLFGGLLLAGSIHAYLYALDLADVSMVIPLALFVPVFGYLFSYLLLHETLTVPQLLACGVIVMGGFFLALERKEGILSLHLPVLGYMAVTTGFQAAQETLFKFTALGELSFISSLFWLHVGLLLYGAGLLIVKPASGPAFMHSVRTHGIKLFGFNILGEAISTIGYAVRNYAILLAPIVVVMTMNSFQPVFVFLLGIVLSHVVSKHVQENMTPGVLFQRFISIAVMVAATIYLVHQT